MYWNSYTNPNKCGLKLVTYNAIPKSEEDITNAVRILIGHISGQATYNNKTFTFNKPIYISSYITDTDNFTDAMSEYNKTLLLDGVTFGKYNMRVPFTSLTLTTSNEWKGWMTFRINGIQAGDKDEITSPGSYSYEGMFIEPNKTYSLSDMQASKSTISTGYHDYVMYYQLFNYNIELDHLSNSTYMWGDEF